MIIVRTPLRISFAGGGTDLPKYYKNSFGAVCSMAINKYVYVTVNNLSAFFPHRIRAAYSQTELVQDSAAIRHPIIREALKMFQIEGGIDINVMADIPAGTGMGSSSTFTVSLLHALHAFSNRLTNRDVLAREASHLEIDILKEPIGKQDQYAAAFGGINLFKFHSNEQVEANPLPMSEDSLDKLMSHLMLFYLGGNREASKILKDQSDNTSTNIHALDEMREQAIEAASILTNQKPLTDLGKLLYRGWELKKNLAPGITSQAIDITIQKALNAGSLGGKLLGAGGTGFLLFFTPPDRKDAVRRALNEYPEVQFEVDTLGSTLLYYG